MATKVGAANSITYEEFEPFCKWQREEAHDTLIVHLPEFKRDQLRVHINNRGILKISGERPVAALKTSKFYKEVVVPRNCNTNGIQAKFTNNHLYITMPKNAPNPVVPEQNKPRQVADQTTKPAAGQDQAAPPQELGSKKVETVQSPTPDGNATRKSDNMDETKEGSASRGKEELSKMAVNAGMIMLVLVAAMAFVLYMYKSTIVED